MRARRGVAGKDRPDARGREAVFEDQPKTGDRISEWIGHGATPQSRYDFFSLAGSRRSSASSMVALTMPLEITTAP